MLVVSSPRYFVWFARLACQRFLLPPPCGGREKSAAGVFPFPSLRRVRVGSLARVSAGKRLHPTPPPEDEEGKKPCSISSTQKRTGSSSAPGCRISPGAGGVRYSAPRETPSARSHRRPGRL